MLNLLEIAIFVEKKFICLFFVYSFTSLLVYRLVYLSSLRQTIFVPKKG